MEMVRSNKHSMLKDIMVYMGIAIEMERASADKKKIFLSNQILNILTLFTASTTPVNTDDLNECISNFDSNRAYRNNVKVLSVPKFFKRSTNDAPFCGKPLSSGKTINNGSSYCTNILGFDGDGNGI